MAGKSTTGLFSWLENSNVTRIQSYGQIVRRLIDKFDLDEPEVLGEYELGGESWPVIAISVKSARMILRYEPGRWPASFLITVESTAPVPSLFGLFDPTLDMSGETLPGMKPEWLHGPYRADQRNFSCELEDEWDLAMLVRILRSVGLLDWAAIPNTKAGE
ncbi:MAG TPA: hypothetical protein DEA96_13645 [Leptospiraceae bacterium]|nr:hypothetical protein [Spirochaetaceae bacterium]HBS06005.1 hypothetical protein [Leptospiraceae bacterium]